MANNNQCDIKFSITFNHLDSSEPLKDYVKSKVEASIAKFVVSNVNVHVILCVEKREHRAEVNLTSRRYNVSAHAVDTDMYVAVNKMIDKLEAQLRSSKERIVNHKAPHSQVA